MKLKKVQKVLLGLIGGVVALTLLFNITKSTTTSNYTGFGFFSMLKSSLIERPLNSIADFVDTFSNLYKVQLENDDLRSQIDEIASMQATINELKRENNELKILNNLSSLNSEYQYVEATITNRSGDSYNNLITIDVGTNDGVSENMAVITSKGLIGKIQRANSDSSIVRLLTTEEGSNKVSCKILINDTESADAILESFNVDKQMYTVTLLSANTTITKGMSVTTSGLGGVFPSGILVGVVEEVEEIPNALTMKIYVKPSASFSDINYVKVVKRGVE